MRIDLPPCDFQNCRYCFDCNCTNEVEHERCRYNYFHDAECDGRCVVLPCKVGDTVYGISGCEGEGYDGIAEHKVRCLRLDEDGRISLRSDVWDGHVCYADELGTIVGWPLWNGYFLTRAEAEAALKGAEHE